MDRFDDDALFAELRDLRPTPRPDFTAELDERAAAGFPRREPRASATPFARLLGRRRAMTPRRRLLPVLAAAVAALAAATTVVAISNSGGSLSGETSPAVALDEASGRGSEAVEKTVHGNARMPDAEAKVGKSCAKGTAGCNAKGEFDGDFFGESGAKAPGSDEAARPDEAEAASGEAEGGRTAYAPATSNGPLLVGGRDIERSSYIVLGTKPGQVSGAAAKVYEAIHAVDGIVLHSSVHSGSAGATGASFSLLIPSAKLEDALASFSSIAAVRERHDATADITEPTVDATEELRDSNASIEGLLKELGKVETEAERESVEKQLREERRHHAAIRASLDDLHRRASMAEVSVRIVTGKGGGGAPAGRGSDSGWGIGDALHDAGRILTIAAGVVLIALAVLAPIALIALLVWLAARFRLRRLRERTLG